MRSPGIQAVVKLLYFKGERLTAGMNGEAEAGLLHSTAPGVLCPFHGTEEVGAIMLGNEKVLMAWWAPSNIFFYILFIYFL